MVCVCVLYVYIDMQEGGGEPPKGALRSAIDEQFGSLEALVQKINTEGAAVQGSGWVVRKIYTPFESYTNIW